MKPTKKQLDLLKILNPYNGQQTTYDEAAYVLGIGVQAVKDRMMRFKKRCPEAHAKFIKLRKDMGEGQRAIDNPDLIGKYEYFDETRIKEIF